jgi:hypothetical protein
MENKDIVEKDDNNLIPGFGVAGQVMCPFSLMAPKICMKAGCESWVELNYGDKKVARCAFSWMPILMTELRQEIFQLRKNTNPVKEDANGNK